MKSRIHSFHMETLNLARCHNRMRMSHAFKRVVGILTRMFCHNVWFYKLPNRKNTQPFANVPRAHINKLLKVIFIEPPAISIADLQRVKRERGANIVSSLLCCCCCCFCCTPVHLKAAAKTPSWHHPNTAYNTAREFQLNFPAKTINSHEPR